MSEITYHGRKANALRNDKMEIVVTVEGGHIAAVTDLDTGINPLWLPPWPSIEPSQYNRAAHPEYGDNAESKLLSGILGHNLCLDVFGGPSDAEAAAGMTVHGEASIEEYEITISGDTLTQKTTLAQSQLRFTRSIRLPGSSRAAFLMETVENLSTWDRPIAWTQHATLGPPFLEKGKTQFRATATKSKVSEQDFTGGQCHMKIGAEFEWPLVLCADGSREDLQVFTNRPVSGAFSTHLMDPARQEAWFIAWSPTHKLAFGYIWNQRDFPWLGIWEENYSRKQKPWHGETLTRGMEFGVSPFPESRRAMIDRGELFGVPGYKWVPAKQSVTVGYKLFLTPAGSMPENAETLAHR